ncbi:MAG: hypothetical protein ACE5GX_15285 [Thermoanaerobaculia bacterium]
MRRLATILTAVAALLVPIVSGFGHSDAELSTALYDQEVVVTGHDELDPAPHVERPSGVFERHCPECVLDKRQSTEVPSASPIAGPRPIATLGAVERSERPILEPSSRRSPRAPPRA